jgi:serine/threonine-protein kinase
VDKPVEGNCRPWPGPNKTPGYALGEKIEPWSQQRSTQQNQRKISEHRPKWPHRPDTRRGKFRRQAEFGPEIPRYPFRRAQSRQGFPGAFGIRKTQSADSPKNRPIKGKNWHRTCGKCRMMTMQIEETGEAVAKAAAGGQPMAFGPYRLRELINSGGMASIWLATNPEGKTVAVRRLHDSLKYNFIARRRFKHGCEILAKIHHHEGIIGYIEHGKINGSLYLVMEFVESSNLKILFARTDPILVENIANILIDSAIALESLHDCGYMHLDFKPENILVTRSGNVRLVDFDLAQPKPDKPKKMSRNPGTPVYMAPEQLQREAIDHRVDIFAFGVMAYELLTFNKPFAGESAEEILDSQLNQPLPPPRQLNEDIPEGLENIILKCLERNPDDRYPYMSVLVRDLKTVLYVEP